MNSPATRASWARKNTHPDTPDAGGEVHGPVTTGELEQFLWTVDQIAGAEPEEPHGDRDEGGRWEADLLGLGEQADHGAPFDRAATPPAAVRCRTRLHLIPRLPICGRAIAATTATGGRGCTARVTGAPATGSREGRRR